MTTTAIVVGVVVVVVALRLLAWSHALDTREAALDDREVHLIRMEHRFPRRDYTEAP